MRRLFPILGMAICLSIISILWIGCSDDSSAITGSNSYLSVDDYFPLYAGFSLYYQVENNVIEDTSLIHFSIGSSISDGSRMVFPWRRTYVNYPNLVDTGYFYTGNDGLYYYENFGDTPELILSGPLEEGHTWERFSTSARPGYGTPDDGYNDNFNAKDDGDYDFGQYPGEDTYTGDGAAKSYPVEGSNTCYIGAVEDVELDNGRKFENCIRVENYSNGAYNYYWYAPGQGLIKYALGINLSTSSSGNVIGEFYQKNN